MLHIKGLRCAFNLQGKVEVLKAGFVKLTYGRQQPSCRIIAAAGRAVAPKQLYFIKTVVY